MTRIGFSIPPRSANPPVKFTLFALSAASTSRSVTSLCSWRAVGSTSTWYCLRPPPIVMTWATPDAFNRRGLTTQSARVRSDSARFASDGNTRSRTRPSITARTRWSPAAGPSALPTGPAVSTAATASHFDSPTGTGSHAAGFHRSVTFQANSAGGPPPFGTRSA